MKEVTRMYRYRLYRLELKEKLYLFGAIASFGIGILFIIFSILQALRKFP